MKVFKASKRNGKYWKDLQNATHLIKKMSLDISGTEERKYEDRLSGLLSVHFESNFIDQRSLKQVVTRISLFNHDHRPDMSIDTDGTAIEVKMATSGQSFRDAIGQALIYRTGYRFVLIIWIDRTKDKTYKKLIEDKTKD